MANEAPAPELGWHRVAEQVAEKLRERILAGELQDGHLLPKEDVLRMTYPISKPSLREAMRILETEGLLSVRRGNVGGALVRWPTAANVAYTTALVLRVQKSTLDAVGEALLACEPSCFMLCAERRDRMETVVPKLKELQQQSLDHVSDLAMSVQLARQFHASVVDLCGNEPLKVLVGALEQIWASHRINWAGRVTDPDELPIQVRLHDLMLHDKIIELIAAGKSDEVRNLSSEHLAVRRYYLKSDPGAERSDIEPKVVRALGSPGLG